MINICKIVAIKPCGRVNHDDGKPEALSWYHYLSDGQTWVGTTIFLSDRIRPGTKKHAKKNGYPHRPMSGMTVITRGSYEGEPGTFYDFRDFKS